jgi:hypothetical protein
LLEGHKNRNFILSSLIFYVNLTAICYSHQGTQLIQAVYKFGNLFLDTGITIVCACFPTPSSSASIFKLPVFCLPSTFSIIYWKCLLGSQAFKFNCDCTSCITGVLHFFLLPTVSSSIAAVLLNYSGCGCPLPTQQSSSTVAVLP